MLILCVGKKLDFDPLRQNGIGLKAGSRYIVNVGTVGQHRDCDSRAKQMIWDNRRNALEIRRVADDISPTASLILKRGFLRGEVDSLSSD
jgi:hypothetical protein